MKTLLLTYFLIFTFCSLAQTNQDCIDSLYSEDFGRKILAIECINQFKPEGAIDIIIELIDEQQPPLQIQFLNALYTLEYEEIETEAYNLISRADDFKNDPYSWDPLDAKVFATSILVYKGDYSTIEYVFEQLNQDEITIKDALSLHLLSYIMDNVPAYKDEAKNILLNELSNSSEDLRYFALLYLAEEFGEEMNNELVDRFVYDNDLPTKILAFQHLCVNNYSGLNPLLKQQLESEEEPSLRIDIADSILYKFGEPSDLKEVMDYQPNEPDETARSLMNYSIQEFIPPRPTDSTIEMIQNLLQYTDELYQFGWIGFEEHYSEYLGLQERIEVAYNAGSHEAACENLNVFLDLVEQNNYRPALTIEGYKFLHYHGTYIKENVEDELGPCE
jgi:hypothetical protein